MNKPVALHHSAIMVGAATEIPKAIGKTLDYLASRERRLETEAQYRAEVKKSQMELKKIKGIIEGNIEYFKSQIKDNSNARENAVKMALAFLDSAMDLYKQAAILPAESKERSELFQKADELSGAAISTIRDQFPAGPIAQLV